MEPDRWLTQVMDQIDPDGWWCFLVCTDNKRHNEEVVGIVFEHVKHREGLPGATRGQLHWAPRVVYLNDAGTQARILIQDTHLWATDETTPEEVDLIRELQGRGSVNVDCPNGCTLRIPRDTWDGWWRKLENPLENPHQHVERWSEIVAEARVSRPSKVDLSEYV